MEFIAFLVIVGLLFGWGVARGILWGVIIFILAVILTWMAVS